MGPNQNETISHKDVLDGLLEATKIIKEIEDDNGNLVRSIEQDFKALKYKLQNVPSPYFAAYVFELEELYGKAEQCFQNMNPERASAAAKQILQKYNSHEYAIDGKSSESRLNKLNKTTNVLGILSSQKQDKTITFKEDELKKGFWQGMVGKSKQESLDGA